MSFIYILGTIKCIWIYYNKFFQCNVLNKIDLNYAYSQFHFKTLHWIKKNTFSNDYSNWKSSFCQINWSVLCCIQRATFGKRFQFYKIRRDYGKKFPWAPRLWVGGRQEPQKYLKNRRLTEFMQQRVNFSVLCLRQQSFIKNKWRHEDDLFLQKKFDIKSFYTFLSFMNVQEISLR